MISMELQPTSVHLAHLNATQQGSTAPHHLHPHHHTHSQSHHMQQPQQAQPAPSDGIMQQMHQAQHLQHEEKPKIMHILFALTNKERHT
ncbi:hypothetical protein DMENIID0001_059680 [Sergentomyia squamirostris]